MIRNGTRAQIVDASVKNSHLWHHFTEHKLLENMRLRHIEDKEKLEEFDNFLTSIGEGSYPTISPQSDLIKPPPFLQTFPIHKNEVQKAIQDIIQKVYGNVSSQANTEEWASFVEKRAILTPLNKDVKILNQNVLTSS